MTIPKKGKAGHLRVRLVWTERKNLACIVCGFYGVECAICLRGKQDDAGSTVGIHRRCISIINSSRSRQEDFQRARRLVSEVLDLLEERQATAIRSEEQSQKRGVSEPR